MSDPTLSLEAWEKWRDEQAMTKASPYHHEEVVLAAALAALNQEANHV